jgi:hypothetical protein
VCYLAALAVLLVVAAARLRKRGGKALATGIQVLVVLGGIVIWPMWIVGLAFAGIWAYWLAQWP